MARSHSIEVKKSYNSDRERMQLNESSPWWNEHVSRYVFAKNWIKQNLKVIDIASGTGYGSFMLSGQSNTCIGGDISFKDVLNAKINFKNKTNLSYIVCDAKKLPIKDNFFDLIVCLETIEHLSIENAQAMLCDFKRILKAGGTLLISTPNLTFLKRIKQNNVNPYHIKEYAKDELCNLLTVYFEIKNIYGQFARRFFKSYHNNMFSRILWKSAKIKNGVFYKILMRLPCKLRNFFSIFVSGHVFLPTLEEYLFLAENIESSEVLLIECKKI
jgi:ubiquinone/menaquinone biosynthesis C-methylase UbiE